MWVRRRWRGAAFLLCLVFVLPLPSNADSSYTDDQEFRENDWDTMARAMGRSRARDGDPAGTAASLETMTRQWLAAQQRQAVDLSKGRVYPGQVAPAVASGGPADDRAQERDVSFLLRSGAKVNARVFTPASAERPAPGVLIVTGDHPDTQHLFWWAARALARHGYVVMTWDWHGAGGTELLGREPGAPVPSSPVVGFEDARMAPIFDALAFFTSGESSPYVPHGWSPAQVAAARASSAEGPVQEELQWWNPVAKVMDGRRVALIGHGIAGSAVAFAQECSDAADYWRTTSRCGGRPYPIRAVIGWDSLSGAFPVRPTVPALDENPDHGIFPEPATIAPRDTGRTGAYLFWRDAGIDVFSLTIRGGTHQEWVDESSPLPATRYGRHTAYFYTLLWLDRYLHPDPRRSRAAADALLSAPRQGSEHLGSARYFSVRFRSLFRLTHPMHGLVTVEDVRAWAGFSAVGDWAGANRDCAGAELPCPLSSS